MPQFAANLSMMFTEVPFLERFGAARKAGFLGVEFLFPYEFPAATIKEQLDQHKLKMVLFNMPPGDWAAGDFENGELDHDDSTLVGALDEDPAEGTYGTPLSRKARREAREAPPQSRHGLGVPRHPSFPDCRPSAGRRGQPRSR